MDFTRLLEKQQKYQQNKHTVSDLALQKWEQAFEIEYTHESTAIEGNTLMLAQTKAIIDFIEEFGEEPLYQYLELLSKR